MKQTTNLQNNNFEAVTVCGHGNNAVSLYPRYRKAEQSFQTSQQEMYGAGGHFV